MKKSILVLGLLVSMVLILGCSSGSKQNQVNKIAYTYNINNKSTKDISILMTRRSNEKGTILALINYDIPAKSKKTINFEGEEEPGTWWGFSWLAWYGDIESGGAAEWWSKQKEIVIDEEGWLTGEENGSIKRFAQISKYYPVTFKDYDVTIKIEDLYYAVPINAQNSWYQGEENTIYNYQVTRNISDLLCYCFPVVGNKVRITWHAKSNVDISKLYCRLVDVSSETGGWMELNKAKQNLNDRDPFLKDTTFIMKENIKADEVFDVDFTLPVEVKPLAQMALCIWYNVGDANPNGPAVISSVIK